MTVLEKVEALKNQKVILENQRKEIEQQIASIEQSLVQKYGDNWQSEYEKNIKILESWEG